MARNDTGRTPGSRRRAALMAGSALAAVALLAMLVGHLVSNTAGTRVRATPLPTARLGVGSITAPTGSQYGWRVTYPITLPQGYQTISGIAADAATKSLWVVAQGIRAGSPVETVFRYSMTSYSLLSSYAIDVANPALDAGGLTPLLVDRTSNVWIGINSTMVEVTSFGAIRTFTLPPVSLPTGSRLPLPPPSPAGRTSFEGIESLAMTSQGRIVVGRRFGTAIDIINPATGNIVSVALPLGTELSQEPGSLAGGGAGPVIAALYSAARRTELGEFSGATWNVSPQCEVNAVSALGRYLSAAGQSCALAGTPSSLSQGLGQVAINFQALDLAHSIVRPASLGASQYAVTASDGIVVYNAATSAQTGVIHLGTVEVAPPSGVSASVSGSDQQVPLTPGFMAANGSGGLWVVPSGGGEKLGLLQLS